MRQRTPRRILNWCAIWALIAVLCAGCAISPRRTINNNPSPTPTPSPGTGGQLYVTSGNSILRFSNAEADSTNSTPDATITGNLTQLNAPQRLLIDTNNDRLYVANTGGSSILVFDQVSTLSGNVAPTRVIFGSNTQLLAPVDMALDTVNDQLYVADRIQIIVFSPASTANQNVSPGRTIVFTALVTGMLLDTSHDQLFVSDTTDNLVQVLGSASLQNLIAQPTALISGPGTQLSGPSGLALDGNNRLFVGNTTIPISITVYPNAATATGNVSPVAVISGSNTRLALPGQLALNNSANNGELYVSDNSAGAILVFAGVSTSGGNIAPARTITSSAFTSALRGIALDTTR